MTQSDKADSEGGKRARLACLNCRRKKVRCSGRQPVCDLCRRLSQRCQYTARGECPPRSAGSGGGQRATMDHLRDRIDTIEGKLEDIVHMLTMQCAVPSVGSSVESPASSTRSSRQAAAGAECLNSSTGRGHAQTTSISTLPPLETLLAAADRYFKYCHNQPYAVFHEQSFREKLASGTLPAHVIFAFYATAIRFSPDPQFSEHRSQAIDRYATESWKSIILPWNGLESAAEIDTVQAILLLGIIDYTAGRCQGAWIKIGLGIRIAHHLQLMKEPPSYLPPVQQEERRRIFWSFYILDRLISCSTEQSPTIGDHVCELQLPCDEEAFQKREHREMPTLDQITSGAIDMMCLQSSPVALLVILSSTLGQCAQYSLKEYKLPRQLPPWDFRSNFGKTSSWLLKIEQLICSTPSLVDIIQNGPVEVDGEVMYSRVGPLVYAYSLYHIGRCLLHHPFLITQRLASLGEKQAPPTSFLEHALHLYKSHAQALTGLLEEVKQAGYDPPGSFYAFFNTTAGVAHAILTQSDDPREVEEAKKNFRLSVNNLAGMTQRWEHPALMIPVLEKALEISFRFRSLLHPSQMMRLQLDSDDAAFLWETVDNTRLSRKKDEGFHYQSFRGEGDGDRSRYNQQQRLSTFPTPFPDELFDIDALISSGILSPNMAQQLSFTAPEIPSLLDRNNSDTNTMKNADDMFEAQSCPTDPVMAHVANQATMSSQVIMPEDSPLGPSYNRQAMGNSIPSSSFPSRY